ncbi:hypothetical protein B0H14DRAFT_2869032 [Mycena olivaceomarginata]|nr:hypothetical protein B0H14DRAFT_2869032 [Mycena olivaceomarginata]
MPKRLASRCAAAFPGSARRALGPLIDAVRGVRAVERERGSGGWGEAVLDRGVVLDSATGFAGMGAGRWRGILPMGLGSDMRVCSGKEEDGEVDLVSGGVAADPTRKDRVRGKARRRESKRELVPESVCSPKMWKRWTADVPTPTYGPPRVGKDNGAVDADERLPSPAPRLFLAPPPPPPRFGSPLAPLPPPAVLAGPSSSTSFALFSSMSPHPSAGGLRQA